MVNFKKKIYPLLELITNDHTSVSIGKFLDYFKDLWERNGVNWPCFDSITSDWSWGNINALMNSWNKCTVQEYTELTYETIFSNTPLPLNITPLYVCYPHLMNMISRYGKTHKVNAQTTKLFLEAIATLVHCNNITLFDYLIDSLFAILLYPFKCAELINAMQFFAREKYSKEIEFEKSISEEDPVIYDNKTKVHYESSPFYKRYLYKFQAIENNIEEMKGFLDPKNKYFSITMARYLLEHLLPYLCFWTIFLTMTANHSSNATVENHFKQVEIADVNHLKVGRFIDIIEISLRSRYNELGFEEPKTYVNVAKKRAKRVSKPDDLKSEEFWQSGRQNIKKKN